MKLFAKISELLSALLLVLTMTSCIFEYLPENEQDIEANSTFVTFELMLPNYPSSRAPYSESDPGSTMWENYVDIENFNFYIFDNNKKIIAKLDRSRTQITCLTPADDTSIPANASNYKHYIIRSLVNKRFDTPIYLMALANCQEYPDINSAGKLTLGGTEISAPSTAPQTDIDAICYNLKYQLSGPITQLSQSQLIPMFGIKHLTSLPDLQTKEQDFGKIHMLRAMAKIEVYVDEEDTGDLETVTLHNYNANGLCAPTRVYDQSDYVKNSYTSDYVDHLSLPTPLNHQTADLSLASHHTVDYTRADQSVDHRKVFTIYVPEYENIFVSEGVIQQKADHSYLTLTFDDEDDFEYTLDFRNYPNGDYFNIERNVYYKYAVHRTDLRQLVVDVHPYYVADLRPDFGIETGKIIWEGLWSVQDTPMSMLDLRYSSFAWEEVESGQTLTLYMLSREPENPQNNSQRFWVSLRHYDGGDPVVGTQMQYYEPRDGILRVTLTQAMLNDIIAYNGLSILGQYFILYRITLK